MTSWTANWRTSTNRRPSSRRTTAATRRDRSSAHSYCERANTHARNWYVSGKNIYTVARRSDSSFPIFFCPTQFPRPPPPHPHSHLLVKLAGCPAILVSCLFLLFLPLVTIVLCFYDANFAMNIKTSQTTESPHKFCCEYQDVVNFAIIDPIHAVKS